MRAAALAVAAAAGCTTGPATCQMYDVMQHDIGDAEVKPCGIGDATPESAPGAQRCILDAIAANEPFDFTWFPFNPMEEFQNGMGYAGLLEDGHLRLYGYYMNATPPVKTTTTLLSDLSVAPNCHVGLGFSLCLTSRSYQDIATCTEPAARERFPGL